jgi:MFS family permease
MSYNLGAICGYIGLGFLADRFGRKPIVMIFFAASLVLTFALYKWTTDLHMLLLVAAINGFFTLVIRRHADRPIRRLQWDGGGVLVHLHPGIHRGSAFAGDQGKTLAGLRSG